MTITTADIKLLASARMTDEDDGGGAMTGTALQDGAENNIFLDVSSTDRAFGRLALRKVYAAVLNSGTDVLLGAHVILDDMPDDADVGAFAFAGSGRDEQRDDAVALLEPSHWMPLGPGGNGVLVWSGANQLTGSAGAPVAVGSVVYTVDADGVYSTPVLITGATSAGTNIWDVTVDGTRRAGLVYAKLGVPSTATPRLASTQAVSGALAIGDTYCDVATLLVPVVPKHLGIAPGPKEQTGIDPALALPAGVAAAFRANDGLVLHHSAETSPATAAGGGTVACGRTNLSSVRVIGHDGASILSGWTADLATGVVTWVSVTGWSQPVKVRHSIEEVLGCSRTGYAEVSGGSSVGSSVRRAGPFTLSNGLTMYCGAAGVGRISVISASGQDITDLMAVIAGGGSVNFRWFQFDLAAGTAMFNPYGYTPLTGSVAAFIASHSPVSLVASGFSAGSVVSAPQAPLNRITFNRPLTRAFPSGTLVSSMLLLGDLQAEAGGSFSQLAWTDVWADSRIGSAIAAQYQELAHPIVVTNAGAISERWALIFTTSTAFRLVGETLGQIATGSTNDALVPVNPATGVPYFTLAAEGWGSGWSSGNVLRFNTVGANAPVWVARTVLPSAPTSTPDSLTLAVRGDINA